MVKSGLDLIISSHSSPILTVFNSMVLDGKFFITNFTCVFWWVLIWEVGSPTFCAAMIPTISPGSTMALIKLILISFIISLNCFLVNPYSKIHFTGAKYSFNATSNKNLRLRSSCFMNLSVGFNEVINLLS